MGPNSRDYREELAECENAIARIAGGRAAFPRIVAHLAALERRGLYRQSPELYEELVDAIELVTIALREGARQASINRTAPISLRRDAAPAAQGTLFQEAENG